MNMEWGWQKENCSLLTSLLLSSALTAVAGFPTEKMSYSGIRKLLLSKLVLHIHGRGKVAESLYVYNKPPQNAHKLICLF